MAEALGVAAAVGGFVSLAKDLIDIGKELRHYYKEVHDAKETLDEIIMAVDANLQPVRCLQELRGRQLAADFEATSALAISLYSYQSRLAILKGKLSDTQQNLENTGGTVALFKRTFRRLNWPFEAEAFRNDLEEIRRYSLVFQFALSVDGFSLLSRSVRDITEILRNQRSLSDNVDSLYRVFSGMDSISVDIRDMKSWNREQAGRKKLEKRTQALDWLSKDRMLRKLSDILSKRHGSTGRWIIEQRVVNDWLQGGTDPQIIWCNGDPGVGKTMAAAIVMDELQQRKNHADDREFAPAFIICDSQNPDTQTAYAVLAAVTKQLLQCLPEEYHIWNVLIDVFESACKDQKRPSTLEIKDLLIKCAKAFSRVHIVVDGIDELIDRNEHRGVLEQLIGFISSEATVTLLATSRSNFDDIAYAFRGAEIISLAGQEDDVRSYVHDHLRSDSAFLDRLHGHDELKQKIERQLIHRCATVFLVAVLQTTWIVRQRTIRQVLDALDNVPQDLNRFYERTLDRIKQQPPSDQRLAFQIFRWVSHASDDLTIDQLSHALSVDWEAPADRRHSFDAKNLYRLVDIVDVCLGLVSVEEQSHTVRFVHDTVKVYFNTKSSTLFENSAFTSVQGQLAATCLTYMAFDDFKEGPCASENDLKALAKIYCFFPYAARHVGNHLRSSSEEDKAILLTQLDRLSENKSKRLLLIQVEGFFIGTEPMFESDPFVLAKYPWIMVVTGWGYIPAVEASLHHGHSLKAETLTGQTPLHVSASNGHLQLVKYLLDLKADYTKTDWRGQRPVMLAALNGHLETFKCLIEQGSSLSWRDVTWNTSLSISAYSNQKRVLTFIMDKDPSPALEDWIKAMECGRQKHDSLPISIILLKGLHPSIQGEYLQKLLFHNSSNPSSHRASAMNIFGIAQRANCQMNIEETLQYVLENVGYGVAMFLLEVSGTEHLPDLPDLCGVLCYMLSNVQDWNRFMKRDRLVKTQHEQLCLLRESQSPLSDELEPFVNHNTWIDADVQRELVVFKMVDLILINIRDDTRRQYLESLLAGPTKIAVLEKLFQSGAKPNVKLLYLACGLGDTEVIRGLSRLSIPLDAVYKGKTPLKFAAKRDQCAAIDLMLELGAQNLDGAMNVTRCDRCALRLLEADRQRQELSYQRHRNALSALKTSNLKDNVATFRRNFKTSQDDLDTCLIAASRGANVGAVKVLLEAGADPRCYRDRYGSGGFLEIFTIGEEVLRARKQRLFNAKIHSRNEWQEKNVDTIIECLSDPSWQQRERSISPSHEIMEEHRRNKEPRLLSDD